MARSAPKTKTEPLLFRPGAFYTCFGDGLCCTDIHGLGPMTKAEERFVRGLHPNPVQELDGDKMLAVVNNGCVFLNEAGCKIHGEQGPEAKPEGCIRFPYRLVETPDGGRVSTHHRCPCRTMGERPAMDEADARMSLASGGPRLRADRKLDKKVPLNKRKTLAFPKWLNIEKQIFDKPSDVMLNLSDAAFPSLGYRTWAEAAEDMLQLEDSSRFGAAVRWFALAILDAEGRGALTPQERPWAENFERAAGRSTTGSRDVSALMEDWILDEFWSLEWATDSNLAHAWSSWASLAAIAQKVAACIAATGVGSEQAAAEALCVIDTVAASEHWSDIDEDFVIDEKRTIIPWVLERA